MVTCSQCGTESADGQPACPECGAALDAQPAPAGTWGESGKPGEATAREPAPDGGREGLPSSPPVLTVHEGGAGGGAAPDGRAADGGVMHAGLALAVADDTIPDASHAADSTGTRAIAPGRASESAGGTVVPLRPEMIRQRPAAADGNGTATAGGGAREEPEDPTPTPAGARPDAAADEQPPEDQTPTPAEARPDRAADEQPPEDPTPTPAEARSDRAAGGEPPAESPAADEPPTPAAEPKGRTAPASPRPPPVLASRLLREDLTPTEPGRMTLRMLALGLGAGGAAVAFGLGGGSAATLAVAGALLLSALFGALPVSYGTRAFGVLAASGLGLVTGGWMGLDTGGSPEVAALALCTTTLAGGLLFRATYRAAHIGRVLTGVGVLLGGAWLATTWTYELTSLDAAWQSWLPAVLQVAFLFLLLLSLLAFMDASTTAGCRAWGVLVLLWLAVRVPVALAVRAWPVDDSAEMPRGLLSDALATGAPLGVPSAEVWTLGLGQVALVMLAAVSLAQVLAVAASRTRHRTR